MNNYKIIESRPELTSSQIIAGMNFGVVKAGALATKVSIAGIVVSKTIISKGFIAAAVMASSALVYKSYTAGNNDNAGTRQATEEIVSTPGHYGNTSQKVTLQETANVANVMLKPLEAPNMACQPSNYDPSKDDKRLIYNGAPVPSVSIDTAKTQQGLQTPPVIGNGMTEEPKVYYTTSPFKASPNAKSFLWQPSSFNHNVEVVRGTLRADCNSCDFNYISGAQLDGKNYKGVWMHVTRDKKIKFKLETSLKNISLIRTEGNKCVAVHPLAIGIGGPEKNGNNWEYLSNKFKTNGVTYTFGDHIDFYFIFEDARAGDKLVIDNFVETLVMEK